MIPFTESLRHAYNLNRDSVCVDAGAFHGGWAATMSEKYGCIVLGFEPIKSFFEIASKNAAHVPRVTLFNCGLGGSFRHETFSVQNDSTGVFAGSEVKERVPILPLVPHLRQVHRGTFDVLKLNIEGMEYEVMEHIIAENALTMFRNYQTQFHTCAPDYQKRYEAIAAALSQTHELQWREPFVWEGWAIK